MEREWINQYEEMATYYNQLMLAGYYDYQQQSLSLAKILPLNASVLEIGIGTGLMAQQLKKDGFKITGVDHSQAMLAQAKELLGSDVRLELADIQTLTWERCIKSFCLMAAYGIALNGLIIA